jgi:hypothetical protein
MLVHAVNGVEWLRQQCASARNKRLSLTARKTEKLAYRAEVPISVSSVVFF